jgi:hypothetical protein
VVNFILRSSFETHPILITLPDFHRTHQRRKDSACTAWPTPRPSASQLSPRKLRLVHHKTLQNGALRMNAEQSAQFNTETDLMVRQDLTACRLRLSLGNKKHSARATSMAHREMGFSPESPLDIRRE